MSANERNECVIKIHHVSTYVRHGNTRFVIVCTAVDEVVPTQPEATTMVRAKIITSTKDEHPQKYVSLVLPAESLSESSCQALALAEFSPGDLFALSYSIGHDIGQELVLYHSANLLIPCASEPTEVSPSLRWTS